MSLSKIRNSRKNGGENMYSRSQGWKKKANYRRLPTGYWYWQLTTALRHLPFLLQHREIIRHQFRIPQPPRGFLAHGLGRRFVGEGRFVGASGPQGVINVHNLQHSRQHRNLRCHEPVRISRPIRMLMMVPNNRQYQSERVQRLADIFPSYGMELHDLPLRRSEIAPFLQN